MHTENTVYMHGDRTRIFTLAANIQNWPQLLPHYREVKVLTKSDNGNRKEAEMAATRNDFLLPGLGFPVRWRSIQVCEPETGQIYFKHIGGIATGMWVVWSIHDDPWGRGVAVTIQHELTYPFSFLNGWFAHDLVGKSFVHAIAGRTLQTIKQIVEQEPKQ